MPTKPLKNDKLSSRFFLIKAEEKLKFNEFFAVPRILLRSSGLITYDKLLTGNSSKRQILEVLICTYNIAVTLFCLTGVVVNFFTVIEDDVYVALEIIPVMLGGLVQAIELAVLFVSKKKIRKLLDNLKLRWNKELRCGVSIKVIKNARRSVAITWAYGFVGLCGVTSYSLRPFGTLLYNYANGYNQTFESSGKIVPAVYPFSINNIYPYIMCNAFESLAALFVMTVWIGFDTFFAQVTTMVSLQLQILGNKFKNLVQESDIERRDGRLLKRLDTIAKQHSELLVYCHQIEDIFNPVVLSAIICAGLNLCICIVTIQKSFSDGRIMTGVSIVTHFVAIFLQISIYCNCAENISHWTENIGQSVYQCQWPDRSLKFKTRIALVMKKSAEPCVFKTYGLYNVSRHQLTRVAQLTGSFISLLNNVEYRQK